MNAAEQPAEAAEAGADGAEAAQPDGAGPAPSLFQQPAILAKGLDAPKRPARLQYSAPTVDGAGGVATSAGAGEEAGEAYPGTPRNAACPCGSGRKYKRCHGDPRMRAAQ